MCKLNAVGAFEVGGTSWTVVHVLQLIEQSGDAQVLAKMRPFWEYLLPDGNRKSKKRIARTTSLNAYKVAVAGFFNTNQGDS